MKSSEREGLLALIEACFAPDGWLVKEKGFHHEPEQCRYALDTARWLLGDGEQIALMEAETGIGKTIGYLIPLLLYVALTGKRAMIATHTIQLQNQMLHGGDMDIAVQYLRRCQVPVPSFEQVLGLAHYLNVDRLEQYITALLPAAEQKPYLAAAARCMRGDGLVESFMREVGQLPPGIAQRDICLRQADGKAENELCELSRARAKKSDIVITSHMMSIIDSISPGILTENGGREIECVVIDEADAFEAAADEYASKKLWPSTLGRMTQELLPALSPKRREAAEKIVAYADQLVTEIRKICPAEQGVRAVLLDQVPESRKDKTFGTLMACRQGILEQAGLVIKQLKSKEERLTDRQLTLYQQLTDSIEFLSRFEEGGYAYGYLGVGCSTVQNIPALEFRQARPGGILYRRLFSGEDKMPVRAMLTSATLNDGYTGGFESIKWAISVPRHLFAEGRTYCPLVFGAVKYQLADPTIGSPIVNSSGKESTFNPLWTAVIVHMIRMAFENGPVLVLCASYQEAQHLEHHLAGLPVISHRRGDSLSQKIAEFKEAGGVLLTPAAWEGVSIRSKQGGQLFKDLVVTRLPISPPDAYQDRVLSAYRRRGGSQISDKAIKRWLWVLKESQAVRKLRQGFGRLIRKQSDIGRIWMGDPRFPLAYPVPNVSCITGFQRTIAPRFYEQYQNASIVRADGSLIEIKDVLDNVSDREEEPAWL